MNKYSTKVGTLKYYLQYFWENFVIGHKIRIEYRANLISSSLAMISHYFFSFILGILFISNFGKIINWNFNDYFLFVILTSILHQISGIFWFSKQLKYQIYRLKRFNSYLYIPGNKFLNYVFFIPPNFSIFIISTIIISSIYFIFNYSFPNFNIILFLIISILLIIQYITIFYFLDSFSWYFLELGKTLSEDIYENLENSGSKRFPSDLLKYSNIKFLFMITPAYFIATLLIPLANGNIPMYFTNYLLIILGIIVISSIGIYINWRYGLKKYEAWD